MRKKKDRIASKTRNQIRPENQTNIQSRLLKGFYFLGLPYFLYFLQSDNYL